MTMAPPYLSAPDAAHDLLLHAAGCDPLAAAEEGVSPSPDLIDAVVAASRSSGPEAPPETARSEAARLASHCRGMAARVPDNASS
ncbi:hypothetical protein BJY21_003966 [Kineosphaera limosa]|nr:hypothetical protein [Kineosphaera limosa]NYE02782.1 hypothetical protein [Kineosphaera limosa]